MFKVVIHHLVTALHITALKERGSQWPQFFSSKERELRRRSMEKELSGQGGWHEINTTILLPRFIFLSLILYFSRARRTDAARQGDEDKTGWGRHSILFYLIITAWGRESIYHSTLTSQLGGGRHSIFLLNHHRSGEGASLEQLPGRSTWKSNRIRRYASCCLNSSFFFSFSDIALREFHSYTL